ncbi:MAG: CocE/NonD family hydrolase [Roseibacillus sp.]
MRDGISIRADVYRPDEPGRYPALYAVSPYQKDLAGLPAYPAFLWRETGPIEWYVRQGYVYVLADARGTGASDQGVWEYFGPEEQTDLYDAIEWIAVQDWCTGKVGMIGQSYFGMAQWSAAIQAPPSLTCIAPYDAKIDHYRDGQFHGGIPAFGLPIIWSFGVRYNHLNGPPGPESAARLKTDLVQAMLAHPTDDEFWRIRSPYWGLAGSTIPTFSIGSWGKNALHLRGNLIGYELTSGPKKLLVEEAGQPVRLGAVRAQQDFERPEFHEKVLLPWYDYWLKGHDTGVMDGATVTTFVSGIDEYVAWSEWPPEEIEYSNLYLRRGPSGAVVSLNDGFLSQEPPRGGEGGTTYSYPRQEWHLGPVEFKPDGSSDPTSQVLTWTTEPLGQDVMIAGPIAVVLYASSDQLDTDFFVKLWDQVPSGTGQNHHDVLLARGWLRASHRELDESRSKIGRPFHPHRDPRPIEPGKVYRFDIEVWPIAHVFVAGNRIRLQLTNGDSSVTDGNYTHFYGLKFGSDTILHDADHPSHVMLPIIPR